MGEGTSVAKISSKGAAPADDDNTRTNKDFHIDRVQGLIPPIAYDSASWADGARVAECTLEDDAVQAKLWCVF